jgi:hypothetical protein
MNGPVSKYSEQTDVILARKRFFFAKKNQKTFKSAARRVRLRQAVGMAAPACDKAG